MGRGKGEKVSIEAAQAARAGVTAALDLGHSKIACFIMGPDGPRRADRTVRVAGVGHVQSRGVKGGGIVHLDEEDEEDEVLEKKEEVVHFELLESTNMGHGCGNRIRE